MGKKKFLSQVETEASVSPMMDLLNDKKNKKDKKKKKLMAASEAYMNESFDDDAFEVKKKKDKKNKKGTADLSMNNSYEEVSESSEGKKKKKNKQLQESISDITDVNDNSALMEPEGSPKKDKKKHKKSAKHEASFVKEEEDYSQELDLNESSYSHTSPKKKNKGMKMLDSDSSFTHNSSKEGKEFDSPGRVHSSKAHKRRKQDATEELKSLSHKKKKGEAVRAEELNEDDNEMDTKVDVKGTDEAVSGMNLDSIWTSEEEVYMLNRLRESLTSNDTAVSYKKTLSNISWDAIAFDNRSADDCKLKLKQLIAKLIKLKSLNTLLDEAESYCISEKNVKSPRDRFVHLFFKKRKADPEYCAAQNTEIIREANIVWGAISKEEKEEYEVQYRNELKKHRKLLDLPPKVPRMPTSIYYDIEARKQRTKSNELRKKALKTFNEMDFDDKIPFIHESVKELYNYHKVLEEYKNSHPEWKEIRRVRLSHTLFQEYLEYLGMPKYVMNGFTAYLAHLKTKGRLDNINGKDRLKHATLMYQKLSEEQKAKFAKEAKSNQNSYVVNYNTWLKNQDEAVADLVKKYYAPKAITGLASGLFRNVVEMSMSKPRFNEEPNKPPTALKLFQLKFERRFGDRYTSREEMRNDCVAAWKVLSQKDKGVYLKRAKSNLEIYKENLLEFVKGIGQSASVYLGFKRPEFFKYFKEDIFEKDFPNEEYPIFVSPQKKDKTAKYDKDESGKKSSKKKGQDEDESESETSLPDSDLAKCSSKLGKKGPIPTASSEGEDDDNDDDDIEDEDENEVSQSWHAGKQASVEKKKATVFNSGDDSSEDDDDDEEEEEEEDEEEEMESD